MPKVVSTVMHTDVGYEFIPNAIFELILNPHGQEPYRVLATFQEFSTREGILAVLNNPLGQTHHVKNKIIIYKFLQKMHSRQTDMERVSHTTKESNGVGFNYQDAPFLSDVAINSYKYTGLTDRQAIAVAKSLKKYVGQLLQIATQGY